MDANFLLFGMGGSGWFFQTSSWWEAFGFVGNALFASRFILQWLHSERRKEVVVPPIFWHLSFWGSLVGLIYAFHLDKPPVILSFLLLPILYGRNLVLLYRKAEPVSAGKGAAETKA